MTKGRRRSAGPPPLAGQISLPFMDAPSGAHDSSPHHLGRVFSDLLKCPVVVVLTDCVDPMVSSRRIGSKLKIRIHRDFHDAPRDVLTAAARYLSGGGRTASKQLQEFLDDLGEGSINESLDPEGATASHSARGQFFDLEDIRRDLNTRYLAGRFEGSIRWGRRPPARRRRSIRLGSYEFQGKLIRIHPALDRDFVPKYYVEWIVYHEMLHQIVPETVKDGRTYFHGPGFKKLEKAFPSYRRAQEWQKKNLERLLE